VTCPRSYPKLRLRRYWLWAFPVALTLIRLKRLAFDSGAQWVGSIGSDFYGYAGLGRILLLNGGHTPAVIPQFLFPAGMPAASHLEDFCEPLIQVFLKISLLFTQNPVHAVTLGIILTHLFNIWGIWLLLWRRFASGTLAGALGVVLGWGLFALSPWPYSKSFTHWHLSWAPLILACAIAAWDLWVHHRGPRTVRGLLVNAGIHALLLAQSIYYGFFMVILHLIAALISARELLTSRHLRTVACFFAASLFLGYGIDIAFVIHRLGGLGMLHQGMHSATYSLFDLHIYSTRLRSMLRGAPGSAWNWIATRFFGQKPNSAAVDGEGFYDPLPKLAWAALALGALSLSRTVRNGEYKKKYGAGMGRILKVSLLWVLGMLFVSLQETPWVKRFILFPLFPFIRSYSRMMMPILCVMAIATADLVARFSGKALGRSRLIVPSVLALWFFLLWIDYGPASPPPPTGENPECTPNYLALTEAGAPVLLISTSQGGDACREREFGILARTGLPLLNQPFEMFNRPILLGSTDCQELRKRTSAAIAVSQKLTVWFEGPVSDWRETLLCLAPKSSQTLRDSPLQGDSRLILTLLR